MVLPASHRIPRVLRYSGTSRSSDLFAYGALTPSGGAFQLSSAKVSRTFLWPATPESMLSGLASFPFARRYSGNHFCFLFLRVLRCFSSPRALRYTMDSCNGDRLLTCRVPPFRNLRICACLRLPVAYRSLPRLSSAYGAMASTLCSY